ncbi:DNA methylase N-4 [Methylobacterium sp. Leaf399]|uniref:site-specific DNA-methyltransferase n=1 Tax=Methylobacterium sp. Leaf399 TaxID=1736364 RepID=UPI0006FC2A44|nr:DNA methyltransferase [Methylobacterium sp. Leaf399]KQT13070.1 DNA methylase N-4 [Methylobacterium sp. Leaf399]
MTTNAPAFPTAGLTILDQAPTALRANPSNARTHSKKQITKIADSIRAFGFTVPLVVDETGFVLAGHGRLLAARQLALSTVPTVRLDHLSEMQKRAYAIADNKIATLAGWDRSTLALELGELAIHLPEIDLDLSVTGFEIAELDLLTADLEEERLASREDEVHEPDAPVSQLGDLWQLGPHRILCGNACNRIEVERLMGGREADMVFTDPPYNVPISGHVMGRGRIQHGEFVMGSGEMTAQAFTAFLSESLGHAVAVSRDGALHYVCMDWRHLPELHGATCGLYSEQKNLIVWSKTNPGQGSLYRSQHELIALYKVGTASHTNNVELGRHGRNRSNVWSYSGVNTFKGAGDLALHPTVKPVALVVDAIKDVTRRGAIVLDPFSGSGTTLLAAEKTGREARVLELDPVYVDVAIRRWQAFTGRDAILEGTDEPWDEVRSTRMDPASIAEAA